MNCPYCQEDIKEGASKCRYCGEFLDSSMSSRDVDVELSKNKQGMSGGQLFGIIVAAIVVGSIVLIVG